METIENTTSNKMEYEREGLTFSVTMQDGTIFPLNEFLEKAITEWQNFLNDPKNT